MDLPDTNQSHGTNQSSYFLLEINPPAYDMMYVTVHIVHDNVFCSNSVLEDPKGKLT